MIAYYKVTNEDIKNFEDYVEDLFNFDDDNIDENKLYCFNNNNQEDTNTNDNIEDNNCLYFSKYENNIYNKNCYDNITKKDNIDSLYINNKDNKFEETNTNLNRLNIIKILNNINIMYNKKNENNNLYLKEDNDDAYNNVIFLQQNNDKSIYEKQKNISLDNDFNKSYLNQKCEKENKNLKILINDNINHNNDQNKNINKYNTKQIYS